MRRFDRRWPAAGLLVVLSALGARLDQRAPRWLGDDPILRPFGRMEVAPGETTWDSRLGAGVDSAGHQESSAAIPVPTPQRPLALRTATVEELCALPGIGPVLATRIIALRDSLGGLRTVEDLLRVKGIGPVRLRRLGPLLRWETAVPSGGTTRDEP